MNKLRVPTVAEMIANNERPDILFWVGCSGSFDDRAKKISKAIVKLIREGRLLLKGGGKFDGKKITFHDPCYLGRANDVYEAPREVLEKLDAELVEMKRSKAKGLCCGAGGAQMFKDAEKGNKEINIERTEDAIEVNADYIATGCPFCNTMMTDGIKHFEKEEKVKVLDIAELISNAADL